MKKILLFCFIVSAHWCTAQIYANKKNINDTGYQYIEIWEKYNKDSGKYLVMVDYGQHLESDEGSGHLKMHDNKGAVLQFNSIIAILNFFYLNGWELAELKTTSDIASYILKRRDNFILPKVEEGASPPIGSN